MDTFNKKPLLSSRDIVKDMAERRVKFGFISKEKAVTFLEKNNNYFKLASYRKNFDKNMSGENKGKYSDLDFAYLIDLSTIDMQLRYLLMKMCLDIEHFLKVRLLQMIEANDIEDGYSIVKKYFDLKLNAEKSNSRAVDEITHMVGNPYCGELIFKYGITKESRQIENLPIWVFIEVVSFGTLREIYQLYCETYDFQNDFKYMLMTVNNLRNAVAHNNCLINYLYSNKPDSVYNFAPDLDVLKFLGAAGVSKDMRRNKMKNPRINQITTTLYVFNELVSSSKVKIHRYKELNDLVIHRMPKNKDYYINNSLIRSAYDFTLRISTYLNAQNY